MSNIKLTIGIPTYNNPDGAFKNIVDLVSQIESLEGQYRDKTEIFISDNSDDAVLEKMINQKFPNIKYILYSKNEVNVGFDRNVEKILTKCNGEYCWTLSDNDQISPDSLQRIISAIETSSPRHILLSINTGKNCYDNYYDLISQNKYNILGGLISSNVFKKDLIPKDISRYFGNDWIHLSILFEVGMHTKIACIPGILVFDDNEKCRWSNNGKTFYTYSNLYNIVNNLNSFGYPNGFSKKLVQAMIHGYPRQIITAKLHGLVLNRKVVSLVFHNTKSSLQVLLLSFCVLFIPSALLLLLKKIWKK